MTHQTNPHKNTTQQQHVNTQWGAQKTTLVLLKMGRISGETPSVFNTFGTDVPMPVNMIYLLKLEAFGLVRLARVAWCSDNLVFSTQVTVIHRDPQ